MSEEPMKDYSADNIQALEGMEHVRMRPSMYIGDVGQRGLHHLVYEVVDNSIDEAMAGHCDRIDVTINEDNSIAVTDNGRGIPIDLHKKEGVSALEVVMTKIGAGGKFDKDSYKVSGGLHGVGVSCVNALSGHLHAVVHKKGQRWEQEYEKGKPLYPVKSTGDTDFNGTEIIFRPDEEIFKHGINFSYETLVSRMREIAFLNKGIRVSLTDKRQKDEEGNFVSKEYYSEEGLKEFIRFLDENRVPLISQVISMEIEKNEVPVEVAMIYNDSYGENLHSYVNNINTHNAKAALIWPTLVRGTANHATRIEAHEFLRNAPVTSGHNYILSDENFGGHYEVSPELFEPVAELDREGLIFHTNHCLGEKHKKREDELAKNSTSQIRYDIVEKKKEEIQSANDLIALFRDHTNYPKSICSHFQSGVQDPSMTCGSGVVDYPARKVCLWRGCPDYDDNFVEYWFDFPNSQSTFQRV
jgi:hypothetical protein